ncbi:MAG TPA: UDP-glucuronic acid decarboxylase family protein [Candidatus Eisenbacteria bacterium]|nr:UDP-glucuronic acid decarboxylase family protein [Candidatus Eisenbacteria bacterium]
MQTIYVAGGAGFIGSNLCARLLQDGYTVVCLDNLITSSESTIDALKENENFHFIHVDVTALHDSILQDVPKPDFIFHLASPASPNKNGKRSFIAYPVETLLANTLGTYTLLELAKKHNARFLFASTSEVYGDPLVSPQPESYWGNVSPNGVRSVYDEGKRCGEAFVMGYVRKFGLDGRIVRIFNTYGPNMQEDDGRVVSNFILQALKGEPLTIYGDGSQTRSFCYVDDLVNGLCAFMFGEGLKGEVINIGNPNEKTIKEFATIIKSLIATNAEIVYQDLPEDDPKQRKPDISKAKKLLSWEPRVSLEEGIEKTVEYFKNLK